MTHGVCIADQIFWWNAQEASDENYAFKFAKILKNPETLALETSASEAPTIETAIEIAIATRNRFGNRLNGSTH